MSTLRSWLETLTASEDWENAQKYGPGLLSALSALKSVRSSTAPPIEGKTG